MTKSWSTRACCVLLLILLLIIPLGMHAYRARHSTEPFQIKIVDAQSGVGLPSLRLTADNSIVCYTRADGCVNFSEDSLMNRSVYFTIEGQDHHFPGGGKTLRVTHGGHVELRIPR